jgi:hypothetical protein
MLASILHNGQSLPRSEYAEMMIDYIVLVL